MAIPPNMYPFYGWEIIGFHLGAIMENAAINSRMKISVHVCMHLCLCVHLGVTLLGHRICISSKAAQLFSRMFLSIYTLISNVKMCCYSTSSPTLVYRVTSLLAILLSMWSFIVTLICVSLMTESKHIFIVLLAIWLSSFVKYPVF